MIKLFPLSYPQLQDEPLIIGHNILLEGSQTTFYVRPQGVESFKLERINAYFPGFKNSDTLPAGYLPPKIKVKSVSRNPFTYLIDMDNFISPLASQQWTGGIRVNAEVWSQEGFEIELSNYNPVATPEIRFAFIGRRKLKKSGYVYATK